MSEGRDILDDLRFENYSLFPDRMESEKRGTEEESSSTDSSSVGSESEEDSRLSGGEADSRRESETGGTCYHTWGLIAGIIQ